MNWALKVSKSSLLIEALNWPEKSFRLLCYYIKVKANPFLSIFIFQLLEVKYLCLINSSIKGNFAWIFAILPLPLSFLWFPERFGTSRTCMISAIYLPCQNYNQHCHCIFNWYLNKINFQTYYPFFLFLDCIGLLYCFIWFWSQECLSKSVMKTYCCITL